VFERLFKERGLPANIRSDNGVPFASAHALFNLSKLAVWWLRLGIGIERIKPAHPQQNGRHERMHLTLKKEATKPAAANFLQQQARFDKFIDIFNNERPHEALDMKCPAEVYQPSPRPYTGLPDIDYPLHDKTIVVTRCGRICLGKKKINFSQVFAGQAVGIKEVHDDIWLVSFMDYDLGYIDLEEKTLQRLDKSVAREFLYFAQADDAYARIGLHLAKTTTLEAIQHVTAESSRLHLLLGKIALSAAENAARFKSD
jgi:hypothetical protein